MIAALNSTTHVNLLRILSLLFFIAGKTCENTFGHLGRYRQTAMCGIAAVPSNALLCPCPQRGYNRVPCSCSRRPNQEYSMGEPTPGVLPPVRSPDDRLDSWKEIAAYFHRDVK